MDDKINIVIPSITTDSRLIRCLEGISFSKYKKFFVTIVLENNCKIQNLKRFKFSIKTIVNKKKINMSEKRNVAVKKYKSKYIAFIDSDAKPSKYWLSNGIKFLKKGFRIVGGPNIPFKKQNYLQKISYYCKRSFFVTAHYNFLKHKSSDRICKWLDSSNFFIERNLYLTVGGMDKDLYIGEDHDFFFRINKKFKNIRIFFSKNTYVEHEDREIHLYFLQRFVYGLNVFAAKNSLIKRIFALIPFISLILIIFFSIIFSFKKFIALFSIFFLAGFIIIFIEISKYVENFIDKFYTVFGIYVLNFFYGLGTLLALIGLRRLLEKNIYRTIKKNN